MGPRPALPNEVATYNDYQRQRLLVKPGMTCYWQTRRNRDSITFDEWVDLDLLNALPFRLGTVPAETPAPQRISLTSSMRRVETPARYISMMASSTLVSRLFSALDDRRGEAHALELRHL